MFVWDDDKNRKNKTKHGIAFEAVSYFDWHSVFYADRSRHRDGEQRLAAIGFLHGKLHTIIFTPREADIRIISFRRTNTTEEKRYAEKDI